LDRIGTTHNHTWVGSAAATNKFIQLAADAAIG
jgi:hypothetical protein